MKKVTRNIVIAILILIFAITYVSKPSTINPGDIFAKNCYYEDVTPENLVGAIYWEHINTKEIVICAVIPSTIQTPECLKIIDSCQIK